MMLCHACPECGAAMHQYCPRTAQCVQCGLRVPSYPEGEDDRLSYITYPDGEEPYYATD